ncbi:MAG TPA: biopolymer transporter ExbD [Bryobacteraceae bacterium]|nr:biopolymer transporter ExbD [Bryobacteraceae bacterium]
MAMSLGSKAQINVTRMIDVLLVLIIIFMVITPVRSRGLNTLVPQQSTRDPEPAAPSDDLVVTVCGGGMVQLNREPVAVADLLDRLAALFRNHPGHALFVRGDKGLEFGQVAEVIDIARGAGLDRIGLMTQ